MGVEVKFMSELIHLSHNVSLLMYHYVCPAKYRRIVFGIDVDKVLKEVCLEIEDRYDFRFIEIGTDKDHVHFLVQGVPKLSPSQIIRVIKSLTAREIFLRCPEVKKKLWGGEFWSDGYYVGTVGKHGNEEIISKYVRNQGREEEYKQLLVQQIAIFG
jgi:REP element-mobilizing transposase RayT